MKPLETLKPFETPSPQIEKKSEEAVKNLAERQKEMTFDEKERLTKRFENITGKAKALLSVFLLSTAICCVPAQAARAFERGQALEPKSGGFFLVMHSDKQYTWGIEYVPKKKEGKRISVQRYVKVDNKTGKATTLGEFDNVFQAAEGASKIPDLPEEIKRHAQRGVEIIQTERNFQASGLTQPTGNIEGKTHVEKRKFHGYGINAETEVEVDEAGNVVRLLQVSKIETQGFSTSGGRGIKSLKKGLGKELSPYEESVLEQVRKWEVDLLENGKHGIDVPGSEKIIDGKKVHNEVRHVYDDKGFDVIFVWEIDEEGNVINYKTIDKGQADYDRYLKIIESAKT